jgi:glutathione S-transferase
MAMQLFQIPFSHNCVKVRRALDLKGVDYRPIDINPALRGPVKKASGQTLVPALVDDGLSVAGSTEILLYLEESRPEPPLLPADPGARAECLVLMDWADAVFMSLTRRLAYSSVLAGAADLGSLFFPQLRAPLRRPAGAFAARILRLRFRISEESDRRDVPAARGAARVAVQRIGGRAYLVGNRLTLADITLAAMAAPLQYTAVRGDESVGALLSWSETILGEDFDPVAAQASEAAG